MRLRNGARILVLPTGAGARRGSGPVAIQLWVAAGTAAENPKEHGCAHLLEHMAFKPWVGPSGVTDIARRIEGLGGEVNAFTTHDETVFHATLPASALRSAMEALVGPVLTPALAGPGLVQELDVVVEEIKQYRDEPTQRVTQDLLTSLYGGHAYGRPVLGTVAEVRSHDGARLRSFHRRNYTGENLVLVAVGPVGVDEVVGAARPWLGRVPSRRAVVRGGWPLAPVRPRIRFSTADVGEVQLALAFHTPPAGHPDAVAFDVAGTVLGHGESGRLIAGLRRRLSLVRDVQVTTYAARKGGVLYVLAQTGPERVVAALREIVAELHRLRREPVHPEELRRAQAVLESDRTYRRETVQGLAYALGYYATLEDDLAADTRYFDRLRSLQLGQVRRLCASHLDPRRAALAVILPRTVAKAQRRRLETEARRTLAGRGDARRSTVPLARAAGSGFLAARLPGGLRVVVRPETRLPTVAGWLVWPGGQRLEAAAEAGTSTLLARLLTRGCSAIDGESLGREIDGMAAVLDGFAGRNSLGIHFECLAGDQLAVIGRALQCASSPTMAARDLVEERRVLIEEIRAQADDASELAYLAMAARLYGRHPFARPRRGTIASLRAVTGQRLRAALGRYPLGGAVLAIAGDVDVDGILSLCAACELSGRPARDRPRRWPGGPVRPPRRPQEVRIALDREQAHLLLGFPGPAIGDASLPALEVLTTILGEQSGRLFDALREREGLVYHVSVGATPGLDAGHVAVYAATSRARLDRTRTVLGAELARVVATAPSVQEIARARASLLGQYEIGLQKRGRVSWHMALGVAYGLGHDDYLAYPARIRAVTRAEVAAVARRIFDPGRCVTAIVASDPPRRR